MEFIKMSYKGLTLHVNPASVKADFSKNLSKNSILLKSSRVNEICFEPTVIYGEGKLIGNDAREFAHELMRVFKSKGSAYLFCADFCPIKVYFKNLSIKFEAKENCINYTFEFVEDCNGRKNDFDFGFTYALEGENLYDISNRTNVEIEKLFELNAFKDLFSVSKGDRIWLC